MLNNEQLQTIEQEVQVILEKLAMPAEVSVRQAQEGTEQETAVEVALRLEEPKILIGERGQTLAEFQHILKLILRRKIQEPFYLSVDVNDYKKNKEEYLKELAQTTADEVVLLKKEKELPPMSSAERRIVHMVLAERTDVASESAGEGTDRHVVVKLKS